MQTYLRPAKPGDICVLLAPSADEAHALRPRQLYLQTLFGGRPAEFVHLTCQRFVIQDEFLPGVIQELRMQSATIEPFPILATSLMHWNSTYRQVRQLRWSVALTRNLRRTAALVESVLAKTGAAPLYASGWQPTLVTALDDIKTLTADPNFLADQSFPFHLFTAQQVVLSRIKDIDDYEIVETIQLGT